MSLRLQTILICCMVAAMLFIIRMIHRKRMSFRYGLGWLFVVVCLVILAAFPWILNNIAAFMGIASPVNTLFFFGFCFAIFLIFSLSITVSKQADRIKKLSQEIAILRKDSYDKQIKLAQEIKDMQSEFPERSIPL